MKRKITTACFTVVFGLALHASAAAGDNTDQQTTETSINKPVEKAHDQDQPPETPNKTAYKVGSGDVLRLSVWKDEGLSREVVVLPDGKISLPLIGQIDADGKSVAGLEDEIRTLIKRYLPDPVLDVSIVRPGSMIIYVIGKVRAPGQIPVQANINVLQALAIAGGLADFADEDSIKIYREKNGQTDFFPFEYDEVIDGNKMEQNIQLQRGDIVVVP